MHCFVNEHNISMIYEFKKCKNLKYSSYVVVFRCFVDKNGGVIDKIACLVEKLYFSHCLAVV